MCPDPFPHWWSFALGAMALGTAILLTHAAIVLVRKYSGPAERCGVCGKRSLPSWNQAFLLGCGHSLYESDEATHARNRKT